MTLPDSEVTRIDLVEGARFAHSLAMKILFFALLNIPGILFADGGLPGRPYLYVEGKGEIEKQPIWLPCASTSWRAMPIE